MKRIDFTFSREGKFVMNGAVSIDVEDPKNAEEIQRKLDAKDFSEFLPLYNKYDEDEWSFDQVS